MGRDGLSGSVEGQAGEGGSGECCARVAVVERVGPPPVSSPPLPLQEERGEAVAGPSSSPASAVASGANLSGRGEGEVDGEPGVVEEVFTVRRG